MSSTSEILVWVNVSDLMQYKTTIPTHQEPDVIKNIHNKIETGKCCVVCKIVDSIDLSKFHPRFIDGRLCIICSDVRILNASNGFIPKCIFTPYKQATNPYKPYNPYVVKAPNPYEMQQFSSSNTIEKSSFYDEEIKKEIAKKKRKELCMHLKSICEDKSSILYGLIHIAYNRCIKDYGHDVIDRVPGVLYYNIIDIIVSCCKYMNQEIKNIIAIILVIDENHKYKDILEICKIMISIWNDIESWLANYYVNPMNVFNELTPKIDKYIEEYQNFAFLFNKTKIISEPLSAISLIDSFIEKNTKN